MSKTERLLITGINGFTGQHAYKHFVMAGYEVIGVVNVNQFNTGKIRIEQCDLTNKEEVSTLVKKVNPHYIIHLAGLNDVGYSWENPVKSFEVNCLSTAYLLEAARKETELRKIIVVGSALEFDPSNIGTVTHPYGLSKTIQTLIAQSWSILYELPITIAKPSNLIGPGNSNGVCSIIARNIIGFEKNLFEQKPLIHLNNLHAERDFIDVRDVVHAYEILLDKGISGGVYDVTTGINRTLSEVINCYRKFSKVNFEVIAQSSSFERQNNIVEPTALNELGWKPEIAFESTLNDVMKFYRETH